MQGESERVRRRASEREKVCDKERERASGRKFVTRRESERAEKVCDKERERSSGESL